MTLQTTTTLDNRSKKRLSSYSMVLEALTNEPNITMTAQGYRCSGRGGYSFQPASAKQPAHASLKFMFDGPEGKYLDGYLITELDENFRATKLVYRHGSGSKAKIFPITVSSELLEKVSNAVLTHPDNNHRLVCFGYTLANEIIALLKR